MVEEGTPIPELTEAQIKKAELLVLISSGATRQSEPRASTALQSSSNLTASSHPYTPPLSPSLPREDLTCCSFDRITERGPQLAIILMALAMRH